MRRSLESILLIFVRKVYSNADVYFISCIKIVSKSFRLGSIQLVECDFRLPNLKIKAWLLCKFLIIEVDTCNKSRLILIIFIFMECESTHSKVTLNCLHLLGRNRSFWKIQNSLTCLWSFFWVLFFTLVYLFIQTISYSSNDAEWIGFFSLCFVLDLQLKLTEITRILL